MRILVAASLALAVAACANVDVKPLTGAADVRNIGPKEKRVWHEANDFDSVMRNRRQIYQNAAAEKYLQGIMDRIYPEFKGVIHTHIVEASSLNAFALPNGSIYFHLGLLARLDNEAQLATVLAHEGAHFILKHGFRERQNLKNSAAFAKSLGAISQLLATSSIYGFSRELELDADRMGYERIMKLGYHPRETVKVFEILAAEAKRMNEKEPFFFSSHPKLTQRISIYKQMNLERANTGRTHEKRFLQKTAKIRLASLKSDLSANRFDVVLFLLENKAVMAKYPPEAYYFMGEAYRLRDKPGDEKLALSAYKKAIKLRPMYAPSYRAVGIHYMKSKKRRASARYLRQYLKMAPQAPDRDYVRSYYNQVRGK